MRTVVPADVPLPMVVVPAVLPLQSCTDPRATRASGVRANAETASTVSTARPVFFAFFAPSTNLIDTASDASRVHLFAVEKRFSRQIKSGLAVSVGSEGLFGV